MLSRLHRRRALGGAIDTGTSSHIAYAFAAMSEDLPVALGRVIPKEALKVKTARASGPGGQHVNRTESKVQLTFDPRAVSWIDEGTRLRVIALAGRNVDSDGCIHVACQEHREQDRNLNEARDKLQELVKKALVRPKRRIATKPSKAAKRRRLDDKRRTGEKKSRRGAVKDD
jgi:ribosome-associated protein